MQRHYFSGLLTRSGWLTDACVEIDSFGNIVSVKGGAQAPSGEKVYGPALPGMSNVHSHAFQRAMAGLAEYREEGQSNFWSWRQAMYGFAAQMTPEALKIIASQLYIEMLKAGYTAVGEFHYLHQAHGDNALAMSMAVMEAATKTGIALTHLPVLYQHSGFDAKPPAPEQRPFCHEADDFIRLMRVLEGHITGPDKLGVALHSLRAVDTSALQQVLDAVQDNIPVHIHIAEQMGEVNDCLATYGQRPVALLADKVGFDKRWCLVHATHMSEREAGIVAESGAVVGLCPTTEANLGDGIFPAKGYLACGGAFGIGSDSHISIDLREELRLLEYMQRLTKQERCSLSPSGGGHTGERLWLDAATGGAQALAQPIGDIAPGMRADIIALDPGSPVLAGAFYGQVPDSFIFAGQPNPVHDVMVAGQWVIKGGKHKAETKTLSAYNALVRDIVMRMETGDDT